MDQTSQQERYGQSLELAEMQVPSCLILDGIRAAGTNHRASLAWKSSLAINVTFGVPRAHTLNSESKGLLTVHDLMSA